MIPGPFGPRATDWWLLERSTKPFLQRYRALIHELRLENGELATYDRPSPHRVQRWLSLAPRIGNDIFIKLFGHGAYEENSQFLLGGALDQVYDGLAQECRRRDWDFYFVSTWEMFQAVEALRLRRDPVSAARSSAGTE